MTSPGVWTASADSPDVLTQTSDSQGTATAYSLWIASLHHTEAYSADGRLLSIRDATGQTAALLYSDSTTPRSVAPQPNLLLTVTAPDGRKLSFTYEYGAKVSQVILPDGGIVAYSYDSAGRLTSVTYPDGKSRHYVYNESDLNSGTDPTYYMYAMTGLIDENGTRLESTAYDSSHRALWTSLNGGIDKTSVTYNPDGSSDVTYPLGGTSHQTYQTIQQLVRVSTLDKPCGECGQNYASRTYDANGYPSTFTDFLGHVSNRTYDTNGLLTQVMEAKGADEQRTTNTTWNTSLRVPLVRTVLDAHGTLVAKQGWAYNATGQVTAMCVIASSVASTYTCTASGTPPAGVRRTVNTYCTAVDTTACPLPGLLLSSDGPRTDVKDITRYTYYLTTDESGCGAAGGPCHHLGDLQSVTSGAGLTTTYVTYDKAGRPTRIKAPNGTLTDLAYTPRGWLASRTLRANVDGSASTADATTALAYNPDGTLHQLVDPDGVTTTYTYDAAHRLTDITDGNGAHVHYTLDAAGNRTGEQVLSSSGAVVRASSRTYNPLGQLTAVTDGLGRTTFSAASSDSYDANGNLVQSQDGLGIQQKQVFDGLNRLISTIRNYQGSDTATANAQSVTSYDALDRVTGFSDPDGLNTTYDIDGLGNVTGLHSPDTGTTARTFDIAGNVATSTDAMQVASTSTYDADNRLSATRYADTTANVQYKYDEADSVTGCTGSYGKGHLTRIVESNGGLVFCYDGRGNVVAKRQTVGTKTTTTAYTWTLGNRLSATVTPNGTTIRYTRDALGNITTVTATQGGVTTTVVSNAVYMPFGPLSSYRLGDGQTVTRTFDATGALTDIDSTAFSLHVKRDVMGNITAIGDAPGVPTALETYGYDALYRLTGLTSPSGATIEAYTYDKTGDRLTKSGPGILTGTYSYASGTHQLTGIGTTTRQVDARGNTTSSTLASGAYTFGYDQRNRLITVQNNGTTVGAYTLNALGQRVQKVVGTTTTRFDYNEASQLLSESTGITSRDYVWLGDLPVGIIDRTGTTTSVAFVHADGLGTPRAVTNAKGVVLWQWPYASNPFGEMSPTSATGYVLNLRFPGQYFDADSNLNYNVNRDYEAATGRYLKSDPIGLNGGASTYLYSDGRPLTLVDSLGLSYAQQWSAGGAAVGGLVGLGASGVLDVATIGGNVVLTPAEVGLTSLVGGGIGYVGGSLADWITGNATPVANESHSNPLTGEPGTEVTCPNKKGEKKQTRRYGDDGFPDKDTDWDHSHGGLGKPHVHDWGRPADGSPPKATDRGPGRSPQPGDPGF
ncbi:RHS repeat-associated core domain-containing protein [Luteibacter sp. PPL201]|uniref:RHS repeat-associated core domain-containing protein n=1 Tax=Luteibacter sahnii TaxID=3021977 RepID=A0ABT6BBV9_9GAMM